jgi:hypothetical protein
MHNVAIAAGPCKPRAIWAYICAYIDTIECFFPCERYGDRRALPPGAARALARIGRVIPCTTRKGFRIGYRLAVNHPRALTLQRLERVAQRYGGILCRVDVAVDIQMATAADAEWMKDWIVRHAVLRWRRRGPMLDIDGTICWVKWKRGQRRYPRNIVIYADKHNRITGELNCLHMELRFLKAASIKRQQIRNVSDLMAIDPNVLFQKHVKWSNAGDNYVSNAMRKAVTADRQRQLPHHHPYTDLYRAHLHEKVKSILHRNGSDRAQNIVSATLAADFRRILNFLIREGLINTRRLHARQRTVTEHHLSAQRQAIIHALNRATHPLGPNAIAAATGMGSNNVRYLLHVMTKDRDVERVDHGKYRCGQSDGVLARRRPFREWNFSG